MTNFESLLDRNRAFAQTDQKDRVPEIPFIPNRQLYVVTCVDPRVDPSDLLGLELADAIVGRNVGGRMTEAMLQDIAWISYLHEVKTPGADWFEIVVIHHTDCGSAFFADAELRHGFVGRGFDETTLTELAVLDPEQTVRSDVAKLLASPNLSPRARVSGYAYDVHTGLLSEVEPAQSSTGA